MSELLKQVFARRFRASDPMPESKPFTHVIEVQMGGEVVECGLNSDGTFVIISGPTGTGKSTLLAMIAAATWKGRCGPIVYKGPKHRRRTLWIDTEMPVNDFQYFQRDVVLKLMELTDEDDALWSVNLTFLKDLEDKKQFTFELFDAIGKGGTIPDQNGGFYDLSEVGYVILDGVLDLMENTTDESSAMRLSNEYQHYVEKTGVPHNTVMHSDKKGVSGPRGTAGSMFSKRASGVLLLNSKHPGEPVLIKTWKGVRGTRPFRPMEMKWGLSDGLPYIEGWEESVDDLRSMFGVSKPVETINSEPKKEDSYAGPI